MAKTLTPKQLMLRVFPTAKVDYYESLRANKKPCYFIRTGVAGRGVPAGRGDIILSDICATPKMAWANAVGIPKKAVR